MGRIEFYDGDSIIAATNSDMVPLIGSKISIRKKTWSVINVTYALDHADKPFESSMRACVDLTPVEAVSLG